MFHDIVDTDSKGVRTVWYWLSKQLLWERDQHAAERALGSNRTAWAVQEGYFVSECTQQAGTNRWNFGLGIISAQHIKSSWLDAAPTPHSCPR